LRPRSGDPKENAPAQNKKSYLPPKQGLSKGTSNKTDHPFPSKPASPEVKETSIQPISFNIDHEMRKIKIIVPFKKLLKNEPFKNSMIQDHHQQSTSMEDNWAH
jgi:hypothetical protein